MSHKLVFQIEGTIETGDDADEDTVMDAIVELMEDRGWLFGGGLHELEDQAYDEEDNEEGSAEDELNYGDDYYEDN